MADDDLISIFQAGMAAHAANKGLGRWLNPYIHLLSDANHDQPSIDEIYRKINAWDAGWLFQTRKEAEKTNLDSEGDKQEWSSVDDLRQIIPKIIP